MIDMMDLMVRPPKGLPASTVELVLEAESSELDRIISLPSCRAVKAHIPRAESLSVLADLQASLTVYRLNLIRPHGTCRSCAGPLGRDMVCVWCQKKKVG
jgi:hypothetical protein